jgi:copper ion binding protein
MHKELNVEGMSCQHCVGRVKKAIETTAGVENVDVDLEGKSARFDCTTASVDVDEILEKIKALGFSASPKA